MANYTTAVKTIIDVYAKDLTLKFSDRVEKAIPFIFDFNYPCWSEEYKKTLEKKILMHYMNKEICCETVALWKVYLEERLNLIMPYYCDLYETTVKKYDYLIDINNEESFNQTVNSNSSSTNNSNGNTSSNTTSKGKVLNSDLPQATFTGNDYGSNMSEDEGENKNTSSSNVTNTSSGENISNDKYSRIKKGLSGARSQTSLLLEYRESLLNIDKMIITELSDLFMMVY